MLPGEMARLLVTLQRLVVLTELMMDEPEIAQRPRLTMSIASVTRVFEIMACVRQRLRMLAGIQINGREVRSVPPLARRRVIGHERLRLGQCLQRFLILTLQVVQVTQA